MEADFKIFGNTMEKKSISWLFLSLPAFFVGFAHQSSKEYKTEKYRYWFTFWWPPLAERFKGARLPEVNDTGISKTPNSLLADYWGPQTRSNEEKWLFPFFLEYPCQRKVSSMRNRAYANLVDNQNKKIVFAYPGTMKVLTGCRWWSEYQQW